MARKPKTVAERNNQKPQAGNRQVRRGHLAAKRAQKANPEELPERPDNSLFGKQRAKEATAEEGGGAAAAPKKQSQIAAAASSPPSVRAAICSRRAPRAARPGGGALGGASSGGASRAIAAASPRAAATASGARRSSRSSAQGKSASVASSMGTTQAPTGGVFRRGHKGVPRVLGQVERSCCLNLLKSC